MGIEFSDGVEDIVEKEEIACYEQFFFFSPIMFSKAVCCRCVKMNICGVKGYNK